MFEKVPKSDAMMDELHAIRAQLQARTAAMTPEEEARWFHEEAVKFASENGYDMVPSTNHPQAYRLVKRTTDTPSA